MLLHLLTAGFGTSRTSGNVRLESGKWAKADTLTISAGHPASALKIRLTIKGSQRLGPCSQHAKIKPAVETLARFLKSGRPPACSKSLAKRGPVEPRRCLLDFRDYAMPKPGRARATAASGSMLSASSLTTTSTAANWPLAAEFHPGR
jgi:hypothetical protein